MTNTMITPRVHYSPSPRDPRHFVPVVNKPGEFVMLPKRELRIDSTYQRALNTRVVHRIANNWNWAACGALLVSLRTDNVAYYIFDGGHRWSAAKEVPAINELPCLVFEMASVTAEAIAFLSANTERRAIGRLAAYKAELLTGAPRALIVDELAREAGRTVGAPSDKTHLSCVSAIQRCADRDERALRRVWPLVIELCQDRPIPAVILQSLFEAERRMPAGQSLADERWQARLLRVGGTEIERHVRGAVALEGVRSERTLSYGVASAINQGLRQGRLQLRERR